MLEQSARRTFDLSTVCQGPSLEERSRYLAHLMQEGRATGTLKLIAGYWHKFDRAKRQWHRHVIQEGGPAGIGTSAQLVDIDGDLDLVAPGKSGLYLFENLRVR